MKLTLHELSQSLDLPSGTIDRWIRQGRIPIQKSGDNFIFKESALKKWAETHHLSFSLKSSEVSSPEDSGKAEKLFSAMKRGGVLYNIKGDDPESAVQSALDSMACLSAETKKFLYEKLIERERLASTGIGKGIAIPHPRNPQSDLQGIQEMKGCALICTCFLEKPVPFNAVDEKPVFVMFIILSPSVKIHLYLLSRLSFCMRDNEFVNFLQTNPDSDELFSKIAEFESTMGD